MKAAITTTTEWDNARSYLAAVRESGRRFITAQICLGWELANRKRDLGFLNGNNQHVVSTTGKTWAEWLNDELSIPRRTADRFISVFEGFRAHLANKVVLKLSGGKGFSEALAAPPAALSVKERKAVEKAISLASDGLTQRDILADLKLIKQPFIDRDGPGKDDAGAGEDDDDMQLVFSFFRPALTIGQLRAARDWQMHLTMLPLVNSDPNVPSLSRLRDELTGALQDIQEAIQAKKQTIEA